MTEAKDDVNISSAPNTNTNPNALNLLANPSFTGVSRQRETATTAITAATTTSLSEKQEQVLAFGDSMGTGTGMIGGHHGGAGRGGWKKPITSDQDEGKASKSPSVSANDDTSATGGTYKRKRADELEPPPKGSTMMMKQRVSSKKKGSPARSKDGAERKEHQSPKKKQATREGGGGSESPKKTKKKPRTTKDDRATASARAGAVAAAAGHGMVDTTNAATSATAATTTDSSDSALSRLLSRGVADSASAYPGAATATTSAGHAGLSGGTATSGPLGGGRSGLPTTTEIRDLLQSSTAIDSYLQQRLLALGAAGTSSGAAGFGGLGGEMGTPGHGLSSLSMASNPSLASIMAARRSQMLPNHLGLMLQMEEYERSYPMSAAVASMGGASSYGGGLSSTGYGGASSLFQGRLGSGGNSLLGSLGGNTGGGGGLGSMPGLMLGGHLVDTAGILGSPTDLHSPSLLSRLAAAERLEALGMRGASSAGEGFSGTDRLSALAMTAAGEEAGTAAAAAATGSSVTTRNVSTAAASAFMGDETVSKRGLGPARGIFDQSRKSGDEMNDTMARIESSEKGRIYQRFRGYQCEQWTEKYNDLLQFKAEKGHCQVPHAYAENVGLARWVKRQRYQYKLMMEKKQSTMTPERVTLLEDIGFIWDSHASTWEERLNELKEYAAVYGDCNVPSSYARNPKLATWIKCQRRQFKLLQEGRTSNMTLERMRELEKIGFNWRVQP